jgi:hypothetical protein
MSTICTLETQRRLDVACMLLMVASCLFRHTAKPIRRDPERGVLRFIKVKYDSAIVGLGLGHMRKHGLSWGRGSARAKYGYEYKSVLTVNSRTCSRTTSRAAAWRNAAGQAGRGPPRVVVAEIRFTFHRRLKTAGSVQFDVPERPAITRQVSRPLMNVHVST